MKAAGKQGVLAALLCACLQSLAQAAVLPTNLEAKVGTNYEPADADEHAIWQSLARLEEGVRTSRQRLLAPELDAYIRHVLERLIGRPAPDLRIYVLRDASPNAAMLPTGMMIVNTGLLVRVRDEAQLAAVLAHEAGHYFRKHALDLYRDDRRKSAKVSAAGAALHSYNDSHGAWMLTNQAILMSSSRFSRDLESEADAYGLALMAQAGYRPRAALEIWEQLVEERRASAAARQKRFRDVTNSDLSTHPPTQVRMTNLADTADHLARARDAEDIADPGDWAAVIQPYLAMLLREQVLLNDPGASLYLVEARAKQGWTGWLRFQEGEVYRLRQASGDAAKALAAYTTATTLADAPPEAWRAHGYALMHAGSRAEAREALSRYLELSPNATGAAMIRFALDQQPAAGEPAMAGGRVTLDASTWKRVHGNANETRWEKVWTLNGPQVDRMTLIDGLPEGHAIAFQKAADDKQVPVFRADMTALDLVSMLEVSYRVKGVTVFDVESIEPVPFLHGAGVKLQYHYASGILFAKRGRCVMRIIGRKLYAMKLEGIEKPSFDAALAEFERLVASARLGE